MTLIIIGIFIVVTGIGFFTILKRLSGYQDDLDFAIEYREKFVSFSNTFFSTFEHFTRNGTFDNEKYIWLTKFVTRIQSDLGQFGIMEYMAAFQRYHVKNYQIIVNSLPKFRDQSIEPFDVNSVDDCLIRYIGNLEDIIKQVKRKIRNPIIWFQEGVQVLLSLPLYLLSWFGIITDKSIFKVKNNFIYKISAVQDKK